MGSSPKLVNWVDFQEEHSVVLLSYKGFYVVLLNSGVLSIYLLGLENITKICHFKKSEVFVIVVVSSQPTRNIVKVCFCLSSSLMRAT